MTAALTLAATMGGCGAGQPRGTTDVPPELTFEGLAYRVYRGPELAAEGEAAHATFRRDTADLTADDVTARFPPSGGQPAARIFARTGSGNLRQRNFAGTGGVRAEQGGEVAVTEEARYTAADGLVHGDRPVEVRSGRGATVRGPAFTLDPREQRLRIAGGARIVGGEGR